MSNLTKRELQAKRDALFRAELDTKENGVRKGTLLVLAICEHTEESPTFDEAFTSLQQSIKAEVLTPKDPYPQYKPEVSD